MVYTGGTSPNGQSLSTSQAQPFIPKSQILGM